MRYFIKKLPIFIFLFLPLVTYAQSLNYLIEGSDVLRITVYDYPDLNTVVRVSKAGTITFPLLGEIEVKGLTPHQARKKIADLLAKGIIVNPQVNVFVEQFKSKRVNVIGEVEKPGQYDLMVNEPTYVADIISNCMGLTKEAGETLTILRKVEDKPKKIIVDLPELLKDGDLSQNIELREGDILYIQRVGHFYIYGEVNKPGYYKIESGLTVIKAISMAEGLTTVASTNNIRIIRKTKNGETTINVELNNPVQLGDEFFKNGDMSQNMKVQDEDVLYIPRAGYFYIYGEVNRPGYYKIEPGLTVIKAISTAEGLTAAASTKGLRVIRKIKDKEHTINVKLNNPVKLSDEFFKNGDMSRDIKVQNEDVLYIPRAAYFYVYGEVNNPGFYKLEPGLTVIKALSVAGGVNEKASTGNIKISRNADNEKITLEVEMDHPVQEEDVVIVGESFF